MSGLVLDSISMAQRDIESASAEAPEN